MTDHKVNKLCCFRAHVVIHLSGLFHHEGVISGGYSIAVGIKTLFIKGIECIDAQALCLCLVEFFAQRNDLFPHLTAEIRHLLHTVVRSALLQVAHRDIVFKAQIYTHLIAQGDELLPDLFHTGLVLLIEFRIGLPGGFPQGAVIIAEKLLDAEQVQHLAV